MRHDVGAATPILLDPLLDPKPWGGRRLAEWGVALPADERIGEAHLAAPGAVVARGELRGRTLGELATANPASWVGSRGLIATGGRPIFPLLIKFISSEADLSIQVHPNDQAAAAAGLGTGKTEAYHILAADPGSAVYLGLLPDVAPDDFRAACLRGDGAAARCLRRVPVEPGMTILIPAGTAHAPGAGITLYEIQQPSNVTFRLDDWGRLDSTGQRRALHHDEGFAVLAPDARPDPVQPLGPPAWPHGRALLVATPYFALERIAPETEATLDLAPIDSPQVLTGLTERAHLQVDTSSWPIGRGHTIVIPAGCASRLSGSPGSVVLRGWVPDLEREIVAPARAAGVSDEALRNLGVYLSTR